ncbi:peptide-methionine (S)-S-oxide reductase [Sporosarcina sp. P26b]|uniref:peptide-methionine (S)-S-oxide reductase MsrA n=2 Tax=Sporosarcina TaxID=1569 RepID=UPI000C168654|nr:peptide-methionine (S)-S-oxide reductase MsrA [Sporosarcina sp. P26b]PIC95004.1 peptide-methionine (S)-S-oxide reductase [Sporosarcina sp. P26b]
MTEKKFEKAAFAGGCFWCMVKPFKEWPGVQDIESGYMGGHLDNPTYEDVKNGESGHVEVVEITFDPALFSYEKLLEVFWQQIDPTDAEGQFHDRGSSYTTAIFHYTEAQQEVAEKSKANLAASGVFSKPIVTAIRPAETFYRAEEYHQDYYIKEKEHYTDNRARSGRTEFIAEHWGK